MEILGIWIGTSILSIYMYLVSGFKIFKDVADAGYKFDAKRVSELSKYLNPNGSKVTLISLLIPIYNIMHVLQNAMVYNNNRDMILDQLNAINALEEMTKEEKEEYLKKPTGLNAIIIPIKSELRLAKASSIKIQNDNGVGEIFYDGDIINNINILKTTGYVSKLTEDEQKELVFNAWDEILKILRDPNNPNNMESFIESINNNDEVVLNKKSDEQEIIEKGTVDGIDISEHKQVLIDVKEKLLSEQGIKNQSQNKELPAYTRKRER